MCIYIQYICTRVSLTAKDSCRLWNWLFSTKLFDCLRLCLETTQPLWHDAPLSCRRTTPLFQPELDRSCCFDQQLDQIVSLCFATSCRDSSNQRKKWERRQRFCHNLMTSKRTSALRQLCRTWLMAKVLGDPWQKRLARTGMQCQCAPSLLRL